MSDDRPGADFRLEVPADVAPGRYANFAMVAHTANEFVLDFAAQYPGLPALVVSRVVTSPRHAKRLLAALQENLRRYEAAFGPIDDEPAAPAAGARTPTN